MSGSKNPALFYAAIAIAIVALAITVYYVIPGINHVMVSSAPTAIHPKHVAAFAALTVICIVAALVTRPKSATR